MEPVRSYIRSQVHGVHMQRFFTHCSPKTQLRYHCVPLSKLLYQSQYLLSCINGCCVETSNSTGTAEKEWKPNRKDCAELFSREKTVD